MQAGSTSTATPTPTPTPTPRPTPSPSAQPPAQAQPSTYNYLLKTQLGHGNRDNWLTKVGPASMEAATRRRLLLRSTRNHAISEPDLLLSLTTPSSSCCSEAEAEAEAEADEEGEPNRSEANVEAISMVSANFKCNDLECSLVLSDYAKCKFIYYKYLEQSESYSKNRTLLNCVIYIQTYIQNLSSLTAVVLEFYAIARESYQVTK